jgi:hypothetical protein
MFVRTKQGELRVYWEGVESTLTPAGLEVSDALAADLRGHVNIVIDEPVADAPKAEAKKRAKTEPV